MASFTSYFGNDDNDDDGTNDDTDHVSEGPVCLKASNVPNTLELLRECMIFSIDSGGIQ